MDLYFSPVIRIIFLLALAFSLAQARLEWGGETGASTLKYHTIATTPRQAALAGAGLADPGLPSESAWNPMAAAWATRASVSGDQGRLSDRLGAQWNTLQMIQPVSSLRLLIGANFLDVNALHGYDEDAMSTGDYGAYAWCARLGLASDSGAFTWGMQGSVDHYNIAEFDANAVMADFVLGYAVGSRLRMAAGIFHYGYVQSFDTQDEVAPLTLQAGLSYKLPLVGPLGWTLHTDLRRTNGGSREVLLGIESFYARFLVLRLGADVAAQTIRPSGGLGLNIGPVEASYGYAANNALKGNHHFGLGYSF